MIYEFDGKYGEFTLECDNEKIILACLYKLSYDRSVYLKNSIIEYNELSFLTKIQDKLSTDVNEFISKNLEEILNVLKNFLPGNKKNRFEYNNNINEIQNYLNVSESDKLELIELLKKSYQNSEKYVNLYNRISKINSILLFKLNEQNERANNDTDET